MQATKQNYTIIANRLVIGNNNPDNKGVWRRGRWIENQCWLDKTGTKVITALTKISILLGDIENTSNSKTRSSQKPPRTSIKTP